MHHVKLLDVLRRSTDYLQKHGVDSPRLSAELLMAHVLEKKRLDLYLEFGRVLTESELAHLRQLIQKRGQRIPIQHILGETTFHGLRLFTTPQALIPRPETEMLVDLALEILHKSAPGLIYDVGTGSGAIALALASSLQNPAWRIIASDSSEEALTLARKNHTLYPDLNIEWQKASLLEHATERTVMVVANLPYLNAEEMRLLSPEAQADPISALDGGEDGLFWIRTLILQAAHLTQYLLLEVGAHHVSAVFDLARQAGFEKVAIHTDLSNCERFIVASREA